MVLIDLDAVVKAIQAITASIGRTADILKNQKIFTGDEYKNVYYGFHNKSININYNIDCCGFIVNKCMVHCILCNSNYRIIGCRLHLYLES